MNAKEIYFGGWMTALLNVIAMCSAGNDPFDTFGFVIAMVIVFLFCSGIRLMLASAGKEDPEDGDAPTKWTEFGSFALGSGISTAITILMFLIGC